jgi:predicted outer membrane protein
MRSSRLICLLAASALTASACGEGGVTLPGTEEEDAALAESVEELDTQVEAAQAFINEAGATLAAEIAASELAISSGFREETRALAETQLSQYRALANELQIAAGAAALALPPGAPGADALNDLNVAPTDFDAAFLRRSIIAQDALLATFEGYGRKGEIRTLAAFAASKVDAIREQRDLAGGVASAVESAPQP